MTLFISCVHTRFVATPVAIHVEAISARMRASDRTPTDGPPVVRPDRPDRIRSTVTAETEHVCVARSKRGPRVVHYESLGHAHAVDGMNEPAKTAPGC